MLEIAGTYSPPFRALTPEEDAAVVDMTNRRAPTFSGWIGLSEAGTWMHEHASGFVYRSLWGVGQHLIFMQVACVSTSVMREHGLEWLFRLAVEPSRAWRRYLVITRVVLSVLAEILGVRKFE